MSKIKLLLIATVSGEFEIDTDDYKDDIAYNKDKLDSPPPEQVREFLLQQLKDDFFNEIDHIDARQELAPTEIKLTEIREAAARLKPPVKPGKPL